MPHLDNDIVKDLSDDQKYLYEICLAVKDGSYSTSLETRQPGKLCHSRWLTLANRVCRLYISTAHPSENLVKMTEFIVKIYAPMWFIIKSHLNFHNGPQHVFKMIELTQELTDNERKMINSVIQRNAYFSPSECLLAAMLYDGKPHIRELACRRIIKTRKEAPTTRRIFQVPQLNFEARHY